MTVTSQTVQIERAPLPCGGEKVWMVSDDEALVKAAIEQHCETGTHRGPFRWNGQWWATGEVPA